MSMWDKAEEAAEKHSNRGGMFLTLADDGDSAVVAFLGEPLPLEVVWTGKTYEDYDPNKHDNKPSLRIKINCFVVAENQMQIWNMNASTFKSLLKLREKYGLDGKLYEITRTGAKGDPKTTYSILPDEAIDETLAERIKVEKLHDLAGGENANNASSNDNPSDNNRELLTGILRNLPKNKLQDFLTRFEVSKVSELIDAKLIDALSYANTLQSDNTNTDDDPFK